MSHTYTPSIGDAAGTEITISDEMHEIIKDTNFHDGQDLQKGIEQAVANNPYNGETIELFQNTPLSNEVTRAFLNSNWGTKFLAELTPSLKQQIVQKATENPDVVQDILEEILEDSIDNTVELTQFLMDKASEHPEEVQQIIEIIHDSGML